MQMNIKIDDRGWGTIQIGSMSLAVLPKVQLAAEQIQRVEDGADNAR